MSKKLYEDLGVNEDATGDEIKRAYKKGAQENHPDKNDGSDESHEKFNQVRRAYDVLSDPGKRDHYDQTGEEEEPDIEKHAHGMLMSAISAMFSSSMDISHRDLIEGVRVQIRGQVQEAENKILSLKKQLEKMDKISKRIKGRRPDRDVFKQAEDDISAGIEASIRHEETVGEVMEIMLTMLEGYEYEVDEQQPFGGSVGETGGTFYVDIGGRRP